MSHSTTHRSLQRGLGLLLALGLGGLYALPAQASQTLTGTYVEFYYNYGLWYDGDSTGRGVRTDLNLDGSWDDWIRWGSPWHHLTF